MKKLISQLKECNNYLSNLDEKDNAVYLNVSLQGKKINKKFDEIADHLAQLVIDYEYPIKRGSHPFLSCDKKLCRKIGFDSITVCPYVGTIHSIWLRSNFMWYYQNDRDNLTIDLYYMQDNKNKDYIKNLIIQELYNFQRDAKWVIKNEYDEKMEEMKNYLNDTEFYSQEEILDKSSLEKEINLYQKSRDYYKKRYEHLSKHWERLTKEILPEGWYCMAPDTWGCIEEECNACIERLHRKFVQWLIKRKKF